MLRLYFRRSITLFSDGPHAGQSEALRLAEARAEVWTHGAPKDQFHVKQSPIAPDTRVFDGTFAQNPSFHAAIAQSAPYLNRNVSVDLRIGGIMARPTRSASPSRNQLSAKFCMSHIDTGGSVLLAPDWYRLQTYVLHLRRHVRETIGPGASFDHVRLLQLRMTRYLNHTLIPVFTNGQVPVRNAPSLSAAAAQLLLGFAGPPPPHAMHAYAYDAPVYGVVAWVPLLRLLQVLHWANTVTSGVTVASAGGLIQRPLFGCPLTHPGRDAIVSAAAVGAVRRLVLGSSLTQSLATPSTILRMADVACGTGSAAAAFVRSGLVGEEVVVSDVLAAASDTAAALCEDAAASVGLKGSSGVAKRADEQLGVRSSRGSRARPLLVKAIVADLLKGVAVDTSRPLDLVVGFVPRLPLSKDESEMLAPVYREALIAADPTMRPSIRPLEDDFQLPQEAVDIHREVPRQLQPTPFYRRRVQEDGTLPYSDAHPPPQYAQQIASGHLSATGAISYPKPRADGFVPYVPVGDSEAAMRAVASQEATEAAGGGRRRRRYLPPTPEAAERSFALRGSLAAFDRVGALRSSWRHAALDSGAAVEMKSFYLPYPADSAGGASVITAVAAGDTSVSLPPGEVEDERPTPPPQSLSAEEALNSVCDVEVSQCGLPARLVAEALLAGGRLYVELFAQSARRLRGGGLLVTASSSGGALVGREKAQHSACDAALAPFLSGARPLFEIAHVEDLSCRPLYGGPDASVDPWSLRPDREFDPVLCFRGDGWTGEKDLDADQQRDLLARLHALRAEEMIRLVVLRRTHHLCGANG